MRFGSGLKNQSSGMTRHTGWKVHEQLAKSDILIVDHKGRLGDYDVIDIHFARCSIFYRMNGFGLWPSIEHLCGFTCMVDYPVPSQVVGYVRYKLERSVVFRLYVEAGDG